MPSNQKKEKIHGKNLKKLSLDLPQSQGEEDINLQRVMSKALDEEVSGQKSSDV